MLGQEFYGRMRPLPPRVNNSPVVVECNKCHGNFILEKKHKEVFVVDMFWARMKDGTLTPANPQPSNYYRLCPSCDVKLKEWFNESGK